MGTTATRELTTLSSGNLPSSGESVRDYNNFSNCGKCTNPFDEVTFLVGHETGANKLLRISSKFIASTSTDNGDICIWDIKKGTKCHTLKVNNQNSKVTNLLPICFPSPTIELEMSKKEIHLSSYLFFHFKASNYID